MNQQKQSYLSESDESMRVINRQGVVEEISFDEIKNRISKLINYTSDEITEPLHHVSAHKVTMETVTKLFDGITTRMLDTESAKVCESLEFVHYNYGILGGRILSSDLYKHLKTLGLLTFSERVSYINNQLPTYYNNLFVAYVEQNAEALNNIIKLERNFLLTYFGFKTLERSYLIKVNKEPIETPQDVFMRVAIATHFRSVGKNGSTNEQVLEKIKNSYDMMSQGYFTHATPTLFNAGTCREQLSSCFLLGTDDSIEGIFKTISDIGKISKWAGGIGVHVSNIRSEGTLIKSTNGLSDGIIPMLKVYNEVGRYINQGGKRKGSIAVYLEPWHADIEKFLKLKLKSGPETERARDLFLALWIPDEFMRRLESGEEWYLMCPHMCPGLTEVYDDKDNLAFTNLYNKYISERKYVKKLDSKELKDLFNKIIVSQVETGVPYILYKDNINRKSNQSNIGIVKSSNLCCEITEVSDNESYSVCNLASIAVNKFIKQDELAKLDLNEEFVGYINNTSDGLTKQIKQKLYDLFRQIYDFDKLRYVTRIITENLNNIIDINFYPVDETKKTNDKNRPIGIGIQGSGDLYAMLNLPYSSYASKYLDALIMEAIYYESISTSSDLALINNSYETYPGSPFSEGKFQYDLWELEGKFDYKTEYPPQMPWSELKDKVGRQGMRNSLLTALMPTASTSQILGNNECFEPYSSIIYKRTTLAGEFKVVNKHLVNQLIKYNLWNETTRQLLINSDGSLKDMTYDSFVRRVTNSNVNFHENDFRLLKQVYKTIWEIKQKDVIDHALARSPYIDQSQSMNLFFGSPNSTNLYSALMYGWKKGIKTGCYYLRSLPADEAIKYGFQVQNTNTNNKSNASSESECLTCSA
jgi:ribonucleoside-diphosphate reductase alpha chain